MIRNLWLMALLALALPAYSQSTILVLGDSLSAAYGIDEQEGWVHLLKQHIAQEQGQYRVINASISGETTAGGLSRLPQLLEHSEADILVLALGANDGLRGLSLKQMRQNLAEMIQLAQDSGSRVLLVGMQLPPNYGKVYSRLFFQSFEELAKEYKVAYLPFLLEGIGEHKGLFQADGLHPSATVQSDIMGNVWRALDTVLNQQTVQHEMKAVTVP